MKSNRTDKILELFPARGPLAFAGMDLLGPIPRTKSGNKMVSVITDRFAKLTRVIMLQQTTDPFVAKSFFHDWGMPYGIAGSILTYKGPQFTVKFSEL